ncbi:MAG: hypothetical protein WA790_17350 [Sulfitobacter sp.]
MNTQDELNELLIITEAKYQLEQQSFQKIVTQENHLRGELARLDELQHQAQSTTADAREMRAIGADILWQGWIGRSKSQLNLQLAKVLATKLHHLAKVQRAYGKVLVVNELLDKTQRMVKKKQAQDTLSQAIQVSLQV